MPLIFSTLSYIHCRDLALCIEALILVYLLIILTISSVIYGTYHITRDDDIDELLTNQPTNHENN